MNTACRLFPETSYLLPHTAYPVYGGVAPCCTRGAMAHREAGGGEYHPLRWLAGMRVCGLVREQAYSKISYSKDSVWEEILRLPCQTDLEDGRAGGYSMSLDFFAYFFYQEKKYAKKNYDPVIARFFSPDEFVLDNENTQDFNRYSYARGNPLKYIDPTGQYIVGIDGNPVTYTRNSDGNVIWSKNASADVQRIGNAMLQTKTGAESLGNMIDAKHGISLRIDKTEQNHTNRGLCSNNIPPYSRDPNDIKGSIITIFEQNIIKFMEKNQNLYGDFTVNEMISSTAGHPTLTVFYCKCMIFSIVNYSPFTTNQFENL